MIWFYVGKFINYFNNYQAFFKDISLLLLINIEFNIKPLRNTFKIDISNNNSR